MVCVWGFWGFWRYRYRHLLTHQRNIIVLGKSQAGKSLLCNLLCERPGLFKEGDSVLSCTSEPESQTFQMYDKQDHSVYNVTMMDTQGWFDSRPAVDNNVLMAGLSEYIKYQMDKLHRVFYVFRRGPVSEDDKKCLEMIREVLSDDALKSGICSMVVTFCDGLSQNERSNVVTGIKNMSGFADYMNMFKKSGDEPEIIPVDFSRTSLTKHADCQALHGSIQRAKVAFDKTKVFRCYTQIAKQDNECKQIEDSFKQQSSCTMC